MRTIGIRHRIKQTKDGEERPTMVAIFPDDGDPVTYQLEDEQAELDFVTGMFPVQFRQVLEKEDISGFRPHHCKWRTLKKNENKADYHEPHLRLLPNGKRQVVTQVPIAYDGLHPADEVAMIMGGSGDRLAAALSRRGEDMDARVYRIPPAVFKEHRGEASKDDDHLMFAQLLRKQKGLFYEVLRRDRDLIRVKEVFMLRQDALKTRIAAGQRLDQRLIGRIFLSEEGHYPEGRIEDDCDKQRASDEIYGSCEDAEHELDGDLERAVKDTDEWKQVFEGIEGCGSRITAGILAAIGDVRRFRVAPDHAGALTLDEKRRRSRVARTKSMAKLKAFCGVHVLVGGKHTAVPPEKCFPRRRGGMVANWNPLARQSLFLFVSDQLNRRPNSVWGKKLRAYKTGFRTRHPEEVTVTKQGDDGERQVKKYTDGHIHKMGIWRTASRFVEWMYRQLVKIGSDAPRPVETLR